MGTDRGNEGRGHGATGGVGRVAVVVLLLQLVVCCRPRNPTTSGRVAAAGTAVSVHSVGEDTRCAAGGQHLGGVVVAAAHATAAAANTVHRLLT